MPERCLSPICNNDVEPAGENWRRTPKKFCSARCKTDMWAIKKTAHLLSGLPTEKKIEILGAVSSRNHHEINRENYHETDMPKTYVCRTWPRLAIGKVRFRNGFFQTSDPGLQRTVEKAAGFGVQIQEVNERKPI